MSGFIGGAAFGPMGSGMAQPSSEYANLATYQWFGWWKQPEEPWRDGLLWPYSKLSGLDGNGMLGMDSTSTGRWGVQPGADASGGQQMKKIIGTCRDSTGAALGSCVVQGFRTSDDTYAGQLTCDSGGYFEFCTPYTQAHYLVAYKAGSPDVAGTTVNTLVGV
jgi:hypothetical protein